MAFLAAVTFAFLAPSLALALAVPAPTPYTSRLVAQVHLAYGHDPATTMNVAWASSSSAPAKVEYRPVGDAQWRISPQPSTVDTYASVDNLWAPTGRYDDDTYVPGESTPYPDYTSPFLHNVLLEGLLPAEIYQYKVVGDNTVRTFTSGLVAGAFPANGKPFVVTIVGDIGQTVDSKDTVAHMLADNAQFAVIIGDLSYADCDQTRWDSSGEVLEPLASAVPMMVCPGNHEIEFANADQPLFLAFEKRYHMPRQAAAPATGTAPASAQWGSHDDALAERYCTPSELLTEYAGGNAWFSVDAGPLHFVSLSCYSKADALSPQYAWLVADLQAVDRAVTPFILVSMHCPWYNSQKNHQQEWQTNEMQESLEPVMMQFGVSLLVTGHVHAYQRSHPVYRGSVVALGPKGESLAPTYVVVGDGGNRETYDQVRGYVSPFPAWSAYANATRFGHGTASVYNATHLHWAWHINPDGAGWEPRDEVWIVRSEAVATDDGAAPPSPAPPKPPTPDADDAERAGGGDDESGWDKAHGSAFLVAAACVFGLTFAAFGAQRQGLFKTGACPDRCGNAVDEMRASLGGGGATLNRALLAEDEPGASQSGTEFA